MSALNSWSMKIEEENKMKIVAVAACTIGIAHTYMAQEAIEQECKKRGYECKVETQGGMGIENEEGKIIKIDPSVVIRDPAEIIDQAEKL